MILNFVEQVNVMYIRNELHIDDEHNIKPRVERDAEAVKTAFIR